MATPIRAKKHRLPDAAYVGEKTVSFTANVEARLPLFTDSVVVQSMVEILATCVRQERCLVPIYCLMPDHLHVMIKGTQADSRPKVAMDSFKEDSGHLLLEHRHGWNWQPGYYDRIMRRGGDWKRQAFYVLQNPMRKGLVADPYAYPFTGSIGFDLVELLHEISW